jgi:hypothetical protein
MTRTSAANLSAANALLAPSITLLRRKALQRGIDIDVWKFMNWYLVGLYWTYLTSVGQVHPTLYPPIPNLPLPEAFTADFPKFKSYGSNNNIFINASLFDIYSTYLSKTILPILGLPSLQFAPLNAENKLQPTNVTFMMTYNCQLRQMKDPFTAFFSVITTVYVFTTAPFRLVIFIATYFKTRKSDQGFSLNLCN